MSELYRRLEFPDPFMSRKLHSLFLWDENLKERIPLILNLQLLSAFAATFGVKEDGCKCGFESRNGTVFWVLPALRSEQHGCWQDRWR